MPITGLPTFTSGILTAAQLNAIVTALEDKFSGKITTGDITWPLVAGGDINLGQYTITGMGVLWGIYDASQRAAGDTLQDVLTTVGNAGGGFVMLPGGWTENLPAGGITIPNNVTIVGGGKSTILAMDASASATAITCSGNYAGLRDVQLQPVAGVDQNMLDLTGDYCKLFNVHVTDTHGTEAPIDIGGAALYPLLNHVTFYNNGSSSQDATAQLELSSCTGARIIDCIFQDWVDEAIALSPNTGSAVHATTIARCKFVRDTLTTDGINSRGSIDWLNPDTVACNGLTISDCQWRGSGDELRGINLSGGGLTGVIIEGCDMSCNGTTPAVQLWNSVFDISINNNVIKNESGDGLVIGLTTGTEGSPSGSEVRRFSVGNNTLRGKSDTAGKGAGLIIAPVDTSSGLHGSVHDNDVYSFNAFAGALFSVGANGTKRMWLVLTGNNFHGSNFYRRFSIFSDMGSTNGNIGGGTTIVSFTMVGNNAPGMASGTDYTYSTTYKCIVADNNNA